MAGRHIYRCLVVMSLFTIRPLASMGNDGSPRHPFHLTREIITQVLSDSLPEIKKSTEESSNKDNTPVIKEVPKSRKQIKPIAVPSAPQIQPIKIIKPKIVKPTIKLRLN